MACLEVSRYRGRRAISRRANTHLPRKPPGGEVEVPGCEDGEHFQAGQAVV